MHKFESQQARRILDRLVGYEISPILWKKVKRGLSAGRVQSVAVRLVVEREREIGAFKPVEYWTVEADGRGPEPAAVSRSGWSRSTARRPSSAPATTPRSIVEELRSAPFVISSIERKERRKNPLAPFITSRLQQEAARKLRFTAKKTMALAQRLYEGLELGDEGAVGLITYMRTDSTRLSDDAVAEVRELHQPRSTGPSSCPTSRWSTRPRRARRTRTRPSAPPRSSTIPRRCARS